MSCFRRLCRRIKQAVKKEEFMSEKFLKLDINAIEYMNYKKCRMHTCILLVVLFWEKFV